MKLNRGEMWVNGVIGDVKVHGSVRLWVGEGREI